MLHGRQLRERWLTSCAVGLDTEIPRAPSHDLEAVAAGDAKFSLAKPSMDTTRIDTPLDLRINSIRKESHVQVSLHMDGLS